MLETLAETHLILITAGHHSIRLSEFSVLHFLGRLSKPRLEFLDVTVPIPIAPMTDNND
jgi:hypothetical protein